MATTNAPDAESWEERGENLRSCFMLGYFDGVSQRLIADDELEELGEHGSPERRLYDYGQTSGQCDRLSARVSAARHAQAQIIRERDAAETQSVDV